MPFNSASYYRNAWRRDALERLAEARRIKASNGERWRLESAVALARSSWRLYQLQRRICELQTEGRNANRRRQKPAYRPEPWTTKGVE